MHQTGSRKVPLASGVDVVGTAGAALESLKVILKPVRNILALFVAFVLAVP